MTQTTYPTVTHPSGWTTTAYPQGTLFKVIAVSADRKRVIHIDKQSVAQVAAMADPATLWGGPARTAKIDVMADLMASVDAVKASKAVA